MPGLPSLCDLGQAHSSEMLKRVYHFPQELRINATMKYLIACLTQVLINGGYFSSLKTFFCHFPECQVLGPAQVDWLNKGLVMCFI